MSTSSLSKTEPKSTRPSERAVATQMEDWLQLAYDFFAIDENGHLSADHKKAMALISRYLETVNRQLKNRLVSTVSAATLAISPSIVIGSSSSAPGPTTASDDDCQICLEVVGGRGYGLLKSCSHKYCQPCVRTLLQSPVRAMGMGFFGPGLECPTCRARSSRVIFSGTFYPNGPQKDALFKSNVCLAHRDDRQDGTRRIGIFRNAR